MLLVDGGQAGQAVGLLGCQVRQLPVHQAALPAGRQSKQAGSGGAVGKRWPDQRKALWAAQGQGAGQVGEAARVSCLEVQLQRHLHDVTTQ